MPEEAVINQLSYHEKFILSCLINGRLDREGIIREYDKLIQVMGVPVSFSDRNKGWTFHRRLDGYLDNLQRLGLNQLRRKNFKN